MAASDHSYRHFKHCKQLSFTPAWRVDGAHLHPHPSRHIMLKKPNRGAAGGMGVRVLGQIYHCQCGCVCKSRHSVAAHNAGMYLWAEMPQLQGEMAGDDVAFCQALIAEVGGTRHHYLLREPA